MDYSKKRFKKKNVMEILKDEYDSDITSGEIVNIFQRNKPEKDEIFSIIKNHQDDFFISEITEKDLIDVLSGYISTEKMVKLIAKSSRTLTVDQVKEVFHIYSEVVDSLISSKNMLNTSFTIPYFGKVNMQIKKGRKAGSKVKRPVGVGKQVVLRTVENDEPDYYRLKVDVSPSIQKKLKENCIEQYNKSNR